MTLELLFGDGVPEVVRHRLRYAAQTFAAVYGVGWQPGNARIRLCYGVKPTRPTDVGLTNAYRPFGDRRVDVYPLHRANLFLGGEADAFPRTHVSDQGFDWLGEIFEWIGAESEHVATSTDELGCVPFDQTVPGRYGLDPEVPWAAIAMRGLEQDISAVVPDWAGRRNVETTMVIATHDLDFLPLSVIGMLQRGLKNALIAAVVERSPRLSLSILRHVVSFPRMEDLARRERTEGVESSSYVIVKHGHQRDADYILDDPRVRRTLRALIDLGMEIGVHGSYMSLLGWGLIARGVRPAAPGRLRTEWWASALASIPRNGAFR